MRFNGTFGATRPPGPPMNPTPVNRLTEWPVGMNPDCKPDYPDRIRACGMRTPSEQPPGRCVADLWPSAVFPARDLAMGSGIDDHAAQAD